uniref:HMA domain-containing protein n=1 Tax=Aegilops tauschii TaxID=37682 RepID=M8BHR3_AEGTA
MAHGRQGAELLRRLRGRRRRLRLPTVELRVSMHCYGCAKKVHKHISKMEGVMWFEVDLERKKVVVTGNVTPLEVLQSVSKVKLAQLWMPPQPC